MLVLLMSAVALWLWLPGKARDITKDHGPRKFWRPNGERRSHQEQVQSNDARVIRELSALLRSGLTFYPALNALLVVEEDNGEISTALKELQAMHRLGRSSSERSTASIRQQSPTVQRLHWCLKLSERSGASLAEVLERLADDLENAVVAQQAFEAAMAGPKATTKLLTWLPLVGFGFGLLIGIDVLQTLATSWLAQLSVLIGAVLWLVNRLWCQHLMTQTSRQALS